MTIGGSNGLNGINTGTGQAVATTTVTDVSTVVTAANSLRAFMFLVNTSTSDVWLGVDVSPTTDKGILLSKNGGTLTIDGTALSVGPINGICKSGQTATILYQEFIR